MKRAAWMAGLTLCVLWGAGPGRAAEEPLRFAFHQGETLTYRVALAGDGTGTGGGYSGTWEGTVVLKVAKLQADGTALIRVTTSGTGRIRMGGETMDFDQEPVPDVIAVVKPDGAIAALRDTAGKPTSLIQQSGLNILSAPVAIRSYAVGSYALFGLVLGKGAEQKWTGSLRHETAHSQRVPVTDLSNAEVTLSSAPVTYTRGAATECDGHPCVNIAATTVLCPQSNNPGSIFPATFCFDTVNGQLRSLKAHAKAPSGGGGISYTVDLMEGAGGDGGRGGSE
jgi:hypothetical protein